MPNIIDLLEVEVDGSVLFEHPVILAAHGLHMQKPCLGHHMCLYLSCIPRSPTRDETCWLISFKEELL